MAGIRPFRTGDEEALYEVCLRTGADGADASDLYGDPMLLGSVFVGPYLRFSPQLAWVYADDTDTARAYVLGAADTARFEALLEDEWWPELRARYPLDSVTADVCSHDREIIGLIHRPERRPAELTALFPAHLHIDLLPEVQGGGNGGAMLRTVLDGLAATKAPGVHLGVSRSNERAIGFYTHFGFTPNEAASTRDELVMVRTL